MKLRDIVLPLAAAIGFSGCASKPFLRIGDYKCERNGRKECLYKDNKLITKTKGDNAFDFFDHGRKVGTLNILADGSYVWQPKQDCNITEEDAVTTYKRLEKCNSLREDKYKEHFMLSAR